jgi:hypothetical protein
MGIEILVSIKETCCQLRPFTSWRNFLEGAELSIEQCSLYLGELFHCHFHVFCIYTLLEVLSYC